MEEYDPVQDEHHDSSNDANREKLAQDLKDLKISSSVCDELHLWISSTANEQRMRKEIDRLFPAEAVAVQIKECRKLHRAALDLAARMDYLGQLTPTGQALGARFAEAAVTGTNASQEGWDVFATRVARDATALALLAQTTQEALIAKKARTGAPTKAKRDSLFSDWFKMLRSATNQGTEHVYDPAIASWNRYFPFDKMNKADAAKKSRVKARSVSKKDGT